MAGPVPCTTSPTSHHNEVVEQLSQLADESKALVENSLDIIALVDEFGNILRINSAAQEVLGYAPSDLMGMKYSALLHPNDRETVAEVDAGLRVGADIVRELETRWIRADGETIFLSLSVRWSEQKRVMYVTARDITEKIKVQQELQKSKDQLNVMLESVGDAFFAVDYQWTVTYANRKAAALVNTMPEEAIGRNLLEVAPSLQHSPALANYQRAMSTGKPEFFEVFWEPTSSWFDARAYPSEDGLSVYFYDITPWREAEKALRKNEQRFKGLFDQAGDAIIITDVHTKIVDANRRACEGLGYSHEELLQLSTVDIDADFRSYNDVVSTLQTDQTQLIRGLKRRKDGSTFSAEVQISRFEEDENVFFQAIVRDVTEREEAQRRSQESEQRLRDIIEMTPASYVLSDGTGQITDVNPALCTASGYARDELIGRHLAQLFAFCPWHGVAFERNGPVSAHGMEVVIKNKAGDDIHVLFNGSIKRDAEGYAQSLTGFMTDITARKQVEQRLEKLATRDTLTDLPNRAFLDERLQQLLEVSPPGASVAVLFIDLDRFKEVNDSLGHNAGDVLIREVSCRLRNVLRPSDIVARLGGDEFVVVAHCSQGRASAASIGQKLLGTLSKPLDIGGQEIFASASIGISMFPQDGNTKELLFQTADIAMYQAKGAGGSACRFFEPQMSVVAKKKMSLELSMRGAIERKEFEVYFQPRVHLASMSVVGMEALLRWNHPELGLVSPAEFIPVAEERGHINELGRWVLQEACAYTSSMREKFAYPLCVSVNVSARQLRSSEFVDQVADVLERSGLPPSLLELEITESSLIEDIEGSATVLRELKNLGLKLAVDDFGTGYSSLAYLRRFPIDVLKLDRSFVMQSQDGMTSFDFIKAFVDMAHALKLSVVAEGIETSDALDFLRSAACNEVQGYFIARPMPLAAFTEYLSSLEGAGCVRKN
ncbi:MULTISPECIES: PAS domain S-box protein [unclassified Massilia]|uniref:sensor domain-containing protein n=1 Tax=unclassified Massilia TaxID=2609279 RepID=UPI00215063A4|nr:MULTISPECIES: EAL domain-containing protein [unclassified Massilia]